MKRGAPPRPQGKAGFAFGQGKALPGARKQGGGGRGKVTAASAFGDSDSDDEPAPEPMNHKTVRGGMWKPGA